MPTVAGALLLALSPATARGQSTQQLLDSAVTLYDAFQVEAARPILQRLISAGFLQQVSPSQKAQALKYLGASAALLATQDSAITYFQGALDFDPFIDLEVTKFAAAEQAAFSEAKRRLFKVAMRPITIPSLVQKDTASMSIRFDFITTQRANVTLDLVGPDTVILFQDVSDGPRSISWQGVTSAGQYAKEGVYQLRISGRQASGSQPETQTASMTLRVEHIHEPLEEPLPALDPTNPNHLLPEQIKASEPWWDLAKGLGLAVVAVGVPLAALERDDIAWEPHAGATAVVALSSAGISYWYRKTRPQIRANVAENGTRRRHLNEFNAAVQQRNNDRLARTKLIVSPVTGLGQ